MMKNLRSILIITITLGVVSALIGPPLHDWLKELGFSVGIRALLLGGFFGSTGGLIAYLVLKFGRGL